MPLRSDWSWLDWDTAVSIVGHDIELKQTYAAIIGSEQRPMIFLDIGANYGTHSILFLSLGIPVISFEPNHDCFEYYRAACALNGIAGRWEQVALGSSSGQIELIYPETKTWLGSVSARVASELKSSQKVMTRTVPLKRLDDYLTELPQGHILIKMDVEGYEREVIHGATELFERRKPLLIFESNDTKSRYDLYDLFHANGYGIYILPWSPSGPGNRRVKNSKEFLASTATNFIAVSGDQPLGARVC
jgi:FkbM family methyltransferase